jgi:hypothetical protein
VVLLDDVIEAAELLAMSTTQEAELITIGAFRVRPVIIQAVLRRCAEGRRPLLVVASLVPPVLPHRTEAFSRKLMMKDGNKPGVVLSLTDDVVRMVAAYV